MEYRAEHILFAVRLMWRSRVLLLVSRPRCSAPALCLLIASLTLAKKSCKQFEMKLLRARRWFQVRRRRSTLTRTCRSRNSSRRRCRSKSRNAVRTPASTSVIALHHHDHLILWQLFSLHSMKLMERGASMTLVCARGCPILVSGGKAQVRISEDLTPFMPI